MGDISRPSGTASTLPLYPSKVEEEKEEDAEKENGIVFLLREIFISPPKKSGPTQPNPQQRLPLGRRSVADCLSRSNPSRKLKPSKKEGDENLKPSFPF